MAMVTVEQVRSKFPQYADVPDDQLMKAVHSKYYADIPYNEFAGDVVKSDEVVVTAKRPSPEEVAAYESEQQDSSVLGTIKSETNRLIGPGSPTYSLAKGAIIDPLLGVNQLLANTGIFGESIKQGANQAVEYSQQIQEQGKQRQGREGFDFIELVGNVVSPANRLLPNQKAAGAFQYLANQAVTGGILSAIMPVGASEDDFWTQKNLQIGIGALLSGAVPGTVLLGKKFGSFIDDLPVTEKAREAAIFKYLSNLVGKDKEEVINKLKDAGEIVSGSKPTAAEAVADVPTGVNIAKEQSRVAGATSTASQFVQRGQEQQAARVSELTGQFGTPDELAAAKATREATTRPMRERALQEADFYGETASLLEEQLKKGQQQFGALTSKAKGDIIKGQIQNIQANGYYPLTTGTLTDKLDTILTGKGTQSNALLTTVASRVKDKLASYVDKRGVISSADLYNIRKEIADDIKTYMANNPGSFEKQATGVETSLKKLIDAEINKAAGSTLWTDYLENYAKHSRKIDQMSAGQALIDKLNLNLGDVEKAGSFAQAVNESGTLIKKSTGLPRYTKLDEVLTPDQMSSVNKVYADLARKEKAANLGKGVKSTQGVVIEEAKETPSILSRPVVIAKSLLELLQRGTQESFDKRIAELMLNPNELATFLEAVPKKDVSNITTAMLAKMSPQTRAAFMQKYGTISSAAKATGVTGEQVSRGVVANAVSE